MRRASSSLLLCASLSLGSCVQAQIVEEMRVGALRRVVQVGALGESETMARALELLSSSDIRLGTVSMYGSITEFRLLSPQRGTESTYSEWREKMRMFENQDRTLRCPAAIQVFKVGADIVLRRVDQKCKSVSNVLSGVDPLKGVIDGIQFEVLEITIFGGTDSQLPLTTFYVRCKERLSRSLAERLLEHFRTVTRLTNIAVSVRLDGWFISDSDFPLLSAAISIGGSIPTEVEYIGAPKAYCLFDSIQPIRCSD